MGPRRRHRPVRSGATHSGFLPGELNVLYAGRLSREKGVDLLVDAFLTARQQDPRLHLVLAGGGPEEGHLRERLGEHATFLGWLTGEDLPRAYASADMFLFASQTDTYGQVVVEAQASGLPVVAVAEGGPATLIEHGETGLLAAPDSRVLAAELLRLAGSSLLRERISKTAQLAVGGVTWEAALDQLGAAYQTVLEHSSAGAGRQVA